MKVKFVPFFLFLGFALPSVFSESFSSGAFEKSFFDVLGTGYTNVLDVNYYETSDEGKYSFLTGVHDDAVDFAWTAEKYGAHFALGYTSKIMNQKFWPHNMTDLDVALLAGIPSIGLCVKASYYDSCIYDGMGEASPKLDIGLNLLNSPVKLYASIESKFKYWKAWKEDVVQLPVVFGVDFSNDGFRGAGVSFLVMPTIAMAQGINDVSGLHPMNGVSAWAGWAWDIDGKVKFGFRPSFWMRYNCINTTDFTVNKRLSYLDSVEGFTGLIENQNWIPENKNREWRISIPFMVVLKVNENIDFFTAIKCGFYWANFDHLSSKHIGGQNVKGTVNETGFALGCRISMSKKTTFQIGTAVVRQLYLDLDGNKNSDVEDASVTGDSISLESLFNAPLSASISIKF